MAGHGRQNWNKRDQINHMINELLRQQKIISVRETIGNGICKFPCFKYIICNLHLFFYQNKRETFIIFLNQNFYTASIQSEQIFILFLKVLNYA